MKINQTKTEEQLQEWFATQKQKLVAKFKFDSMQETVADSYSRRLQEIINKAGDRLRIIKYGK